MCRDGEEDVDGAQAQEGRNGGGGRRGSGGGAAGPAAQGRGQGRGVVLGVLGSGGRFFFFLSLFLFRLFFRSLCSRSRSPPLLRHQRLGHHLKQPQRHQPPEEVAPGPGLEVPRGVDHLLQGTRTVGPEGRGRRRRPFSSVAAALRGGVLSSCSRSSSRRRPPQQLEQPREVPRVRLQRHQHLDGVERRERRERRVRAVVERARQRDVADECGAVAGPHFRAEGLGGEGNDLLVGDGAGEKLAVAEAARGGGRGGRRGSGRGRRRANAARCSPSRPLVPPFLSLRTVKLQRLVLQSPDNGICHLVRQQLLDQPGLVQQHESPDDPIEALERRRVAARLGGAERRGEAGEPPRGRHCGARQPLALIHRRGVREKVREVGEGGGVRVREQRLAALLLLEVVEVAKGPGSAAAARGREEAAAEASQAAAAARGVVIAVGVAAPAVGAAAAVASAAACASASAPAAAVAAAPPGAAAVVVVSLLLLLLVGSIGISVSSPCRASYLVVAEAQAGSSQISVVPSEAPAASSAAATSRGPSPPAALAAAFGPLFLLAVFERFVAFLLFFFLFILVADALPSPEAATVTVALKIELVAVTVVGVCHFLVVVVVVKLVNEAGLASRALLLLLLVVLAAAWEIIILIVAVGGRRESRLCSRARARRAVAGSSAGEAVRVVGGAPLQLLDLRPDLLAPGGVLERERDVGAQGGVGPRDDGAVALPRVGRGGSGSSSRSCSGSAGAVVVSSSSSSSSSSSARGAEPVDQERPRVLLGDDDEPCRVGLLFVFCFREGRRE